MTEANPSRSLSVLLLLLLLMLQMSLKGCTRSQQTTTTLGLPHQDTNTLCATHKEHITCRPFFQDALDKIERAMVLKHIPGMTISIVYPDKHQELKVWAKVLGFQKLGSKPVKVQLDTKFAIGSITKSFTTALLCILLEEQKDRFSRFGA